MLHSTRREISIAMASVKASITSRFVMLAVALCCLHAVAVADKLCYACNSYMSQCQHPTLAAGTSNVFQARCTTKCFTRQGEDDAIYRGCFDAFKAVKQLNDNYVGCRNQTWNNRVRRWCLCDTDLCNTHNIGGEFTTQQSQPYARSTSSVGSTGNASGSGISSSSSTKGTGISTTSHHTHHVVVHQHTYPPSPLPTPYIDYQSARQGYDGHLSNNVNATNEKVATESRHQVYQTNPAEYRTVWNNWHVDLSNGVGKVSPRTDTAAEHTEGPTGSEGGWIDAPRGVLHSVHQYQQPARNYGDLQFHDVRPDRESQQGAKSGGRDAGRNEALEPITNNETDATGRTRRSGVSDDSTASFSTHADVVHREEYERMLPNNPQVVDGLTIIDGLTTKQQKKTEAVQNDDAQREGSPLEISFDDGGELLDNGTAGEVLEYPYNQEFISHPIDWAPVEYIPTSDSPMQTSSIEMKQAPETSVEQSDIADSKDYPYNQYKEHLESNDNYADYPEVDAALKEGPTQVEEQLPEELVDRAFSVDYPYNQFLIMDGFGNSQNKLNEKSDAAANSSEENRSKLNKPNDTAVKFTVHSDGKTSSVSPHRHEPRFLDDRTAPAAEEITSLPIPRTTVNRPTQARPEHLVVHHQHYEEQQRQGPISASPQPTIEHNDGSEIILHHQPEHQKHSDSGRRSNVGIVKEILHTKSNVHRPLPLPPSAPAVDEPRHESSEPLHNANAGAEINPLKTKDEYGSRMHRMQQRHHGNERSNGEKSRGLLAKEANDDEVDYENMEGIAQYKPQNIVPQIRCAHTGYYQNPKDCTQFVACLFDHNTRTKVLHLMRCPSGLVWDNHHKLCMESSSTCREGLSQADLDSNYVQFFADVNAASSSAAGRIDIPTDADQEQQQQLLNDIKNKHDINEP